MRIYWDLFTLGFFLATGPCVLYCAPIILPYIAGTKKGLLEGLKSILVFVMSRAAVYVILGLFAGLLGRMLLNFFHRAEDAVAYSAGVFITLLGIVTMFGKNPHARICRILDEKIAKGGAKTPALLGIAAGLLPCPPLLGVLSYIAVKSRSVADGAALALSFGIGGLFSPLILMGAISGALPVWFSKSAKAYSVFRILCGATLALVGLRLIFQRLFI